MPSAYIAVLGEREALSRVVREERMAFPEQRLREAMRLRMGDRLFLYATRGASTTRHGTAVGSSGRRSWPPL